MHMRIDKCGHHGLAGEIDARCPLRQSHFAFAPDLSDLVVRDDESGILDNSAIARDQPRAFE
jgi:hypothetical protein